MLDRLAKMETRMNQFHSYVAYNLLLDCPFFSSLLNRFYPFVHVRI